MQQQQSHIWLIEDSLLPQARQNTGVYEPVPIARMVDVYCDLIAETDKNAQQHMTWVLEELQEIKALLLHTVSVLGDIRFQGEVFCHLRSNH